MKIKSIKWNGHYQDRNFNGETLGKNYKYSKATVMESDRVYRKDNHEYCIEIIEESPTIYLIKFHDETALRIFNPIEVEFTL